MNWDTLCDNTYLKKVPKIFKSPVFEQVCITISTFLEKIIKICIEFSLSNQIIDNMETNSVLLFYYVLQNHEIAGITNSEIKKFGDPVLSISLLESQNSLLRKYIVKITVFCIFVSLCVLAVVNNASLHLT